MMRTLPLLACSAFAASAVDVYECQGDACAQGPEEADETTLLQLSRRTDPADASTPGPTDHSLQPNGHADNHLHTFNNSFIREQEQQRPTARLGGAYEAAFCDATIDNFCKLKDSLSCRKLGKDGNGKFQQRYFIDDTFWGGDGYPILLDTAGEWEASAPGWYLHQWELAREHQALMVTLEHRFYGGTQPFDLWSTENLRYLTVEQAAADVARFVKWFKKLDKTTTLAKSTNDTGLDTNADGVLDDDELQAGLKTGAASTAVTAVGCTPPPLKYSPRNSKVFTLGCSYGGLLASQSRHLHPHEIDGALSSSGPELPVYNFGPMYHESMIMLLGRRVIGGSDQCLARVRTALQTVVNLGTTEGWGSANLKGWRAAVFYSELPPYLVTTMDTEQMSNYLGNVLWYFYFKAGLEQDYALFQADLPLQNTPVYQFCDYMINGPVDPFVALSNWMGLNGNSAFDVSYVDSTKNLQLIFGSTSAVIDATPSANGVWRQWLSQICNGWGWLQQQVIALEGADPQNPVNVFVEAGLLPKENYTKYVLDMLQRPCQYSFGDVVPAGSAIDPAWGTWANDASFKWDDLNDKGYKELFGGRDQRKSSRVAFINSDLDPWRTAGLLQPGSEWYEACVSNEGLLASGEESKCRVSAVQRLGRENEALLVNGGSHCSDFYNLETIDRDVSFNMASYRAVKERKSELLGEWISTDKRPWVCRRRRNRRSPEK